MPIFTCCHSLRQLRSWAGLLLLAGLLPAAQAQTPIGTLDPAPFYHWQQPRPVGEVLNDLHVFNDSTALALSTANYVVRTTNGGKSWRYLAAGSVLGDEYPQRLSFVGDTLGWLGTVGTGVRIKSTADGGNTWTTCLDRPYSGGAGVVDLQFVTRQHGFLLYYNDYNTYLTPTTDGGQTWTPAASSPNLDAIPGKYGNPVDLHFISPTEGWLACGLNLNGVVSGSILHTTDGGQTWQRQTPLRDSTVQYMAVGFAHDGQHGWVFSSSGGPCYRTTDGGRTWLAMQVYVHYNDRLSVLDAQHVTIGGITTSDGGITWTDAASRQGLYIKQTMLAATGQGWGLGSVGSIFRTTAYGQQWQPDSAVDGYARSIRGFEFHGDARRGWVRRAGGFPLRTTTGGQRWTAVDEVRAVPADWQIHGGYQVVDVATVDFDTATALVNHRLSTSSFAYVQDLLRTTDGGQSWQVQALPPQAQTLTEIAFYNSRHGCLVGYDGTAYMTHDGGQSWQLVNTGTSQALTAISWASPTRLNVTFTDMSTGNAERALVLSEDGGQTWRIIPAPGGYFYSPVAWRTATEAWLESSRTELYRSTDGGHTWTTVPISLNPATEPAYSTSSLQRITFLDSTRAVAVDLRPLYSADKGQTWTATSLRSNLPPILGLLDRYNGWFGGDGSLSGAVNGILRYSEKSLQADSALARTSYCAGETLALAFTRTGSFSSDEQAVVAELSDAHGRFGRYPRVVGQGSTSPVAVTLPADLPAGTGYLLRVSRPDHSVLGGDNRHALTVLPQPTQPVVEQLPTGQVAVRAPLAGASYQWYLNGQPLAGATQATYPASGGPVPVAGSYSVVATVNGCPSAPSAPLAVVLATLRAQAGAMLQLYPNPAGQQVTVTWANQPAPATLTLLDALGRPVLAAPLRQGQAQLVLTGLPAGVYAVRVQAEDGAVLVQRLVVAAP